MVTLCISTSMVLVLLGLVVFSVQTSRNLSRWVKENLEDDPQIVFRGEQAGMLEVWADLYAITKEEKYLRAAERIAGYFTDHIRPDGLTDSDFCQPAGEERIDNLAGAIGACGLMELGKATGDSRWQEAAEKLVRGMLEHCADWTEERPGILTHCTASYHDDGAGRHTNIIYGDYFLTEALMKLTGKDPMLWL